MLLKKKNDSLFSEPLQANVLVIGAVKENETQLFCVQNYFAKHQE